MTKTQLEARIAELETMHPTPVPRSPTHLAARERAHAAGIRTRHYATIAGRNAQTATTITTATVGGFFAGLFGKP